MFFNKNDKIIICKICGSRDIIVTAKINLYLEEIEEINPQNNKLCWCEPCFQTTPTAFIDSNLFMIQVIDTDNELSLKEFEDEYINSLTQGEIASIRLLNVGNEMTIYTQKNDIITVKRSK